MPRTARIIPTATLVHVRCRFVDGRFELDESARAEYRRRLDLALHEVNWTLISYALMSSHVHLGLISGTSTLRSWLHPVHVGFAGWINARRRYTLPKTFGHVLGGRPNTNVLPLDHAFPLIAYHHHNPVEAGVVARAVDSLWTSHRQYLGLSGPFVASLDVARGLALSGKDRASFADGVAAVERADTAIAAGGLRLVIAVVSRRIGIREDDLCGGSKTPEAVAGRRLAIWMAVHLGFRVARVARALGISRAAAARLRTTATVEVRELGRVLADEWRAAAGVN